jgi:hypothetical protein
MSSFIYSITTFVVESRQIYSLSYLLAQLSARSNAVVIKRMNKRDLLFTNGYILRKIIIRILLTHMQICHQRNNSAARINQSDYCLRYSPSISTINDDKVYFIIIWMKKVFVKTNENKAEPGRV